MKTMKGLIILAVMLFATQTWAAAGSCVQTTKNYPANGIRQVIFTCTGSTVDGSIPNTAMSTANANWINGWQLFQVDAYPTALGTAPDAADVFILDANSLDLLGSEDGSTTAYGGLNLIHATLKRSTAPDFYTPRAGLHSFYFPYITGGLTLKVSNQATVSANYTIVLSFYKDR